METDFMESFDGNKIFYRLWDQVKSPKGVIMVIHGMVEHSARYDDFAKFCNKQGYIVFCWDLRAHGQTVGDPKLVGKYKGDLFKDCVADAMFFANYLNDKYKLPLMVLGHSFGSFILQRFIQEYHNYALAIFSGSAYMKGPTLGFGLLVARITRFFCGKNAKAKSIYNLSFKSYGKNFDNGNWLTRDEKIWKKYNEDEYCGNVCSANFYCSMFKHLKDCYKKKNLAKIDTSLPLIVVSGGDDPVGGYEKLVYKLSDMYKKLGVKLMKDRIFDHCRHEILNELNKDEIMKFILLQCDKSAKPKSQYKRN